MNRFSVGLVLSVVILGNVVTSLLLLRDSRARARVNDGSAAQREATDSLRKDMSRLSVALTSIPSPSRVTIDRAETAGVDLAARLDDVIQRLEALEESIAGKNEAGDELAVLKPREASTTSQ
jgi:hypothetical protein